MSELMLFSDACLFPFVGVTSTTCLKGLLGDTNPGGMLKLKIDEFPGPVGVLGTGPGEAAVDKNKTHFECCIHANKPTAGVMVHIATLQLH